MEVGLQPGLFSRESRVQAMLMEASNNRKNMVMIGATPSRLPTHTRPAVNSTVKWRATFSFLHQLIGRISSRAIE